MLLLPAHHTAAQTPARAAEGHQPLAAAVAPPADARFAQACEPPRVDLTPLRGGRTHITVYTPCRTRQLVTFTYAGAVLMRWLDADGRADLVLDCFAGDREPIVVAFEDQTAIQRQPVIGDDMREFSKVAIVWSSSVDLDLHAFEYGAAFGTEGHVWSGQARTLDEAGVVRDGRGHGYLSTVGSGSEIGMNVEVYTFVHQRGELPGVVKLAVDYASRGSRPEGKFCGKGHLAEMRFTAYILDRGSGLRTFDLAFAPAPCGTEIRHSAQFNARLIPDLVIRR